MNGQYDGTPVRILGLLNLKAMAASGDRNPETVELMGDKGHVWKLTEDEFVFSVKVNLSMTKSKGLKTDKDLSIEDITKLPTTVCMERIILGLAMSQYEPLGIVAPILIILKIRHLYYMDQKLHWIGPNLSWETYTEPGSKSS